MGRGAAADFYLLCARCQRNIRATEGRMRQIVKALLIASNYVPSVVADISSREMARMF